MRKIESACMTLVGGSEVKRPLGKCRHRWDGNGNGNIKMNLREIGCGIMNCIHLPLDKDKWKALENMVMNLQVP
jgi:hypothetical protein